MFDSSVVSEEVLAKLVQVLLDEAKWNDSICDKDVAQKIWKLLIDWSRKDLALDEIRSQLTFMNDESLREVFVNFYETNKTKIRSQLHSIRWEFPSLTDVDWSVSKVLRSEDLAQINAPTASITLHSLPSGSLESNEFKFDCNLHQLQELNWKVKEALNSLTELKEQKL